jgi:type I restriction enzyme S subunit
VSALPTGWAKSALSEITSDCEQRIPGPDEAFKYIDISSVDRNTKRIELPQDLIGAAAPSRARKLVRAGDVLVSMTRPNLNAVTLVPPMLDGQIASTGFDVLRPVGVEPRWVFYLVRTQRFVAAMSDLVQGALYPAIRSKDVRGFSSGLAPLAEQKRIADKLDALLARVDACRERLDRVPAILKRFRQSVLAAATSGELTREWREERGLTRDWAEIRVEEIAFVGTGATPRRSNGAFYSASGTPWITSAMTGLAFVTEAEEFVSEAAITAHRLKKYPAGTLLVAMYGEGKTRGQVTELRIEATVNQACAAICVDERKALTAFVRLVLEANYLKMRDLAEGGNQPNLNLSKIRKFPLLLPSLEEQRAITGRVDAIYERLRRTDAHLTIARRDVDRVAQVALVKAFRGELVPQDPNDEPASALLERVRRERAGAPIAPIRAAQRVTGRQRDAKKTAPASQSRRAIQARS